MTAQLRPYPAYPAYKESGVPWLGAVPQHWTVHRLRNVAEIRVSNVDKVSSENEQPVRLCNYTDVYKHDRIFANMPFMQATATIEETKRFQVKSGDVLITKDSEAWNDIGVPALVETTADDLVCGYHLALLRPYSDKLVGGYLFRAMQSVAVTYQFHIAANGVTRFGLAHSAIKSIWMPLPTLPEQAAIIRFLNHLDLRIGRYIRAKQNLIKLLEQQKQAIIHQVVTRGLDPGVRLKPSGVEWLGDVPEHWEVKRAKYLFREVDSRSTDGTEILLSLRMYRGLIPHNEVSTVPIGPSALVGFKHVQPGQVVMNRMRAAIGMFGVATTHGLVSPDYAVLEPSAEVNAEYYLRVFRTRAAGAEFRIQSKGLGTGSSGFMRLYSDRFGTIKLPKPPTEEQYAIVHEITVVTASIERTLERLDSEIRLAREYRTRLIADVVTGKLDVRGVELPELEGLAEFEIADGDTEPDSERTGIEESGEEYDDA